MEDFTDVFMSVSRYILPVLGTSVLIYCAVSLLKFKFPTSGGAVIVAAKGGQVFPLEHWENAIGRSSSCDIVIDDDAVSRFHGVIARRKKGWTVIDTYSKTGIFVNGQRIERRAILENGDTVAFGGILYKFQL